MSDVKLLNGLLWAVNGLLAAGIAAFAWLFLLTPARGNLEGVVFQDEAPRADVVRPAGPGDGVLRSLPNPLEPRAQGPGPAAPTFRAVLKGTLPTEKEPRQAVAFIKSPARNVDLVAYVGEPILHNGEPFEEYRGWTLVEVTKDTATFTNGTLRETLTLDPNAPSGPPAPGAPRPTGPAGPRANRAGQPYNPEAFRSRLLASAENRQVWGMDPEEIDWALQNSDRIMDQEFQVTPYAGGGLKIESVAPGSLGAMRGLVPGDVVKDVNGQPLTSLADLRTLMNSPALRQSSGLRLTVERAGKPIILEYRPLPRQ